MCKFKRNFHILFFCQGMLNYSKEKEGKNTMARKKRDPKKTALVQAILNEYQPESVEDM